MRKVITVIIFLLVVSNSCQRDIEDVIIGTWEVIEGCAVTEISFSNNGICVVTGCTEGPPGSEALRDCPGHWVREGDSIKIFASGECVVQTWSPGEGYVTRGAECSNKFTAILKNRYLLVDIFEPDTGYVCFNPLCGSLKLKKKR